MGKGMMKDIDFYTSIATGNSGIHGRALDALMELFMTVKKIEKYLDMKKDDVQPKIKAERVTAIVNGGDSIRNIDPAPEPGNIYIVLVGNTGRTYVHVKDIGWKLQP